MNMKSARKAYRARFSREAIVSESGNQKVRLWENPRPSLKVWVRSELKGRPDLNGKLAKIAKSKGTSK